MTDHAEVLNVKGSTGRQYHLKGVPGEVGGVALMPGGPFRVQLIADRLEGVTEIAHAREYRTVVGRYKGDGHRDVDRNRVSVRRDRRGGTGQVRGPHLHPGG